MFGSWRGDLSIVSISTVVVILTAIVSGEFFLQPALDAVQLSHVLRSQDWGVFATSEDKIYFVNQANQCTYSYRINRLLNISVFFTASSWSLPRLKTKPPVETPKSRSASPQLPASPKLPTSPLVNNVRHENES